MSTRNKKKEDAHPLGQNPSSSKVLDALGVPKLAPSKAKPTVKGRTACEEALDDLAIPFAVELLKKMHEDFIKSKRDLSSVYVPNVLALSDRLHKWSGRDVLKVSPTDSEGRDAKTTIDNDALNALIDARIAEREIDDADLD